MDYYTINRDYNSEIIFLSIFVIVLVVLLILHFYLQKRKRLKSIESHNEFKRRLRQQFPNAIILVSLNGNLLEIDGDFLIYTAGNNRKSIPIGAIPYIEVKPPYGINPGVLTVPLSGTPSDFVHWGFGLVSALGTKIQLYFSADEYAIALQIEKYIRGQSRNPSNVQGQRDAQQYTSGRGPMPVNTRPPIMQPDNLGASQSQIQPAVQPTRPVQQPSPSVPLACVPTGKKSIIVSILNPEYLAMAFREFIVIDIETTGLYKDRDHIVEIAAIKYRRCVPISRFVTLVNPQIHIPECVVQVHGITDHMVTGAPTIDMVIPKFLEFLGNSLLVGHNANFDIGFIEVWARRCGYDPAWGYVDTISVAKKFLPNLPDYKQPTVLNAIGYKQNQYHRAEEDCRGCAEIMLLGMNTLIGSSHVEMHHSKKETAESIHSQQAEKVAEDSHEFRNSHDELVSQIDVKKLLSIRPDKDIKLQKHEVQFLRKINRQGTTSPYIAGYWTYEHNLDYQKTLERLISGGYLEMSSPEYTLSKYIIDDLKAILRAYVPYPVLAGKKQEFINQILEVVPDDVLENNFRGKYYVVTKKGYDAIEGELGELYHYKLKRYDE